MDTVSLNVDSMPSQCGGHLLTIYKCIQASEGGNYIFRGSTKRFSDASDRSVNTYSERGSIKIHSTLSRKVEQSGWTGGFNPFSMEKEIVDNAVPYFPAGTSVIDILTELRHYGQDLSLLDFTKDIYVALFFACSGDYQSTGELVIFKCPVIYDSVGYGEDGTGNGEAESAFIPSQFLGSKNRVQAQSSIFVRTPKGYIDGNDYGEDDLKVITIAKDEKKLILDHLLFCQNITFKKIYNDVIGCVRTDITTALLHLMASKVKNSEGDYYQAIAELTKALEKHPQLYEALHLLADAFKKIGEPEKGLVYLNKAIAIHSNPIEGLYTKSLALYFQGEICFDGTRFSRAKDLLVDALSTVNHLLELKSNHIVGRILRGSINEKLSIVDLIVENYKALELPVP